MTSAPSFTETAVLGTANFSTANTDRTGLTGTVATLVTGASGGTRINSVRVTGTGSTTAGNIRLYVSSTGLQANNTLLADLAVTAIVAAAGTAGWTGVVSWVDGLLLPVGATLGVATHIAEGFAAVANGGA